MPSNKLYSEDQPIEHDVDVQSARAAVHQTLNRLEDNIERLADKIESTQLVKAVTVGWPVVKTSWKVLRVVRKNPWMWVATGSVVCGLWAFNKMHAHRKASSK